MKIKAIIPVMVLCFTIYFWNSSWTETSAMHIMEGFLPLGWALFWWVLMIPFLAFGLFSIRKTTSKHPEAKTLLGVSTAFAFVISAFKLPSVTGSSSHATGVGLGTFLFGPVAMSVVGFIVLTFQALLLAHGGISTLGANTFSMAIVGPLITFFIYRLSTKLQISTTIALFLATALGDLATYITTSFQLAIAFPDAQAGMIASFLKFLSVFAVTQVPLAITEGILTVFVVNFLMKYNSSDVYKLISSQTSRKEEAL